MPFHRTRMFGALSVWLALIFSLNPLQAQVFARRVGDVRVFATVPTPPGFPEGIVTLNDKVYVAGPATLTTLVNNQPSAVLAFDAAGKPSASYPTAGENLQQLRSNACVALDSRNRIYVVNQQLGVYRINLE